VRTNAKLVCVGSIRQDELDAIVALDSQILELCRLREQRCGPLVDRLIKGVRVEPGPHSAGIEILPSGSSRLIHLVIDGHRIE
jgi:hypothetical protein